MSFERMKKSFRSILGYEEQSIQQQSESKSQVQIENKFQKIPSREKNRIDVHQYAKQRLIEHYKKLIKQSDFYQLPVISFHQTQPKKVCENIEIARNPRWDRQSQSQDMLDSVTSRYIEPSESTNKLDFSKLLSNSKEEVKLDKKFSKCQKKSTMNLSQVEEQPIQKTEEKYISIQPITQQSIAQQVDTPNIETKKEEIQQIQQKHIIKNSVEKIIPKDIQKVQDVIKDQEVQKVQEIVKQEDIVQQKKQSPPKIIESIIDQPKTTEQSNLEINPFTSTVSNPLFNAPWLSNQPTIITPQIVQPQQQSFNLFQQDPIQQFQYPQQENVLFPFQQQNTFNSQINTYPQQNLFNNSTNLFPQQQQQQNLFGTQGQQQQNLFQIPQNYTNQQTQNYANQQSLNLFTPQQNQIQNQQSNLFQINQDTFNQQQQNQFSNQQNPFPNTQNQFQIFPQTQQQDNSFQFQTHSWGGGSFSANDQKQQLQAVNLFSAGADLFQQQENKTNQSQISADRYKNKMQKSNQQRLG